MTHARTHARTHAHGANYNLPPASRAGDNYTWHLQTFYEKFKQFDFSVASPRTHHICGRCHKDITDGTDVLTDEKYDR